MKHEITRLEVHQNAKVFAVISAVIALIIAIPVALLISAAGIVNDGPVRPLNPLLSIGSAGFMVLIYPILYLVFTYIFTAIFCLLFNFVARMTGGIRYETKE